MHTKMPISYLPAVFISHCLLYFTCLRNYHLKLIPTCSCYPLNNAMGGRWAEARHHAVQEAMRIERQQSAPGKEIANRQIASASD